MTATALTVAQGAAYGVGINSAGLQAVDSGNDNSFTNDGNTILVVKNASGGVLTVTGRLPAGTRTANTAINKTLGGGTVANGDTAVLGPFPTDIYSGTVTVGWSTGTSVTAAPVKLTPTPPAGG